MKLLHRSESACTFLIGRRERDVFLGLLRRYPVLSGAHYRSRGGAKSDAARANQELLEEALAEQQRENRRNLEEMLAQPARFQESEFGFTFTLFRRGTGMDAADSKRYSRGKLGSTRRAEYESSRAPAGERTEYEVAWALEIAGNV